MKHKLSDKRKLAAKAQEQNCEVMFNPKDYVHIAFIEKDGTTRIWMPCYDMRNDANKYQIN